MRSFVHPGDTFSTWKIVTKLCGNLRSCRTRLIDLEHLDHDNQKNIELVEHLRKTDYRYFPLHLEKVEKEAKLLGKRINLNCPPHIGWKIRWNFATIFSRLREQLIYRDIHRWKIVTLKIYIKVMMYNISQWRHLMANTWLPIKWH